MPRRVCCRLTAMLQTLEIVWHGSRPCDATSCLFDKGLLLAMPTRFGLWTILARAISSNRLSTGWAMAFSGTVVSTMTRSNSADDSLGLHGGVDRRL